MTPKEYARVRRLQALLRTLDGEAASIASAAARHGYSDQAHATHDLLRWTGGTPGRLVHALRGDRGSSDAVQLAAAFPGQWTTHHDSFGPRLKSGRAVTFCNAMQRRASALPPSSPALIELSRDSSKASRLTRYAEDETCGGMLFGCRAQAPMKVQSAKTQDVRKIMLALLQAATETGASQTRPPAPAFDAGMPPVAFRPPQTPASGTTRRPAHWC
ncbi:hypothetical protein G6F65_018577 [Rhizopus arrhizus]|nr:hypothetical protein G6F65_018577 [Rhizopus arrhizus]